MTDKMNNNKPNYYAVIPAPVRYDKELTCQAKLLYGEISALANKEGYCWANNRYFSDLYEVNPNTISRAIQELLRGRYIEIRMLKDNTRHIFIKQLKGDDPEGGIIKNDDRSIQLSWGAINKIVEHNNTINIINNNNKDVDMLITWMKSQFIRYFGTNILQADVDNFVNNILEYGSEWVNDALLESHRAGVRKWNYCEQILKNKKKKKLAADREEKYKDKKQTDLEFKPITKKEAALTAGVIGQYLGELNLVKPMKDSTPVKTQDNAAGKKKAKVIPKYGPGTEARRRAESEFNKELEKGK